MRTGKPESGTEETNTYSGWDGDSNWTLRNRVIPGMGVIPGLSQEQTGSLYFTGTIYDFGTLSEDAVPPTHIFTFINRGSSPVLLREVWSLCFCAVPEFPHRPVLPGQIGEIKVTFKPKGHPGKFNKRIMVVTTEQPDGLNLRIKGNVLFGKPLVPAVSGCAILERESSVFLSEPFIVVGDDNCKNK